MSAKQFTLIDVNFYFFFVGLTFMFQSYVLGLFIIEGGAMTHAVRRWRFVIESQDLFWDCERNGNGARFSDYLWLIADSYHPSIFR